MHLKTSNFLWPSFSCKWILLTKTLWLQRYLPFRIAKYCENPSDLLNLLCLQLSARLGHHDDSRFEWSQWPNFNRFQDGGRWKINCVFNYEFRKYTSLDFSGFEVCCDRCSEVSILKIKFSDLSTHEAKTRKVGKAVEVLCFKSLKIVCRYANDHFDWLISAH